MPSLRYDDVAASMDWLSTAFGFTKHLQWADPSSLVLHAELRLDRVFIELSKADDDHPSPKQHGAVSSTLIVFVEDVDRHFRVAKAAGATILAEPADKPWGLRQYLAADPEGYQWEFTQFIKDVPYQDWGAEGLE